MLTVTRLERYPAFERPLGVCVRFSDVSVLYMGVCLWRTYHTPFLTSLSAHTWSKQLLDVLNAHFQKVFGISKLQSTLLQLAYFVRVLVVLGNSAAYD